MISSSVINTYPIEDLGSSRLFPDHSSIAVNVSDYHKRKLLSLEYILNGLSEWGEMNWYTQMGLVSMAEEDFIGSALDSVVYHFRESLSRDIQPAQSHKQLSALVKLVDSKIEDFKANVLERDKDTGKFRIDTSYGKKQCANTALMLMHLLSHGETDFIDPDIRSFKGDLRRNNFVFNMCNGREAESE